MPTPQGVRQICEYVMKQGRTLIITEFDGKQITFDNLPCGTVYIDEASGFASVKLKGEIWWKPLFTINSIEIPKITTRQILDMFRYTPQDDKDTSDELKRILAETRKASQNILKRSTAYKEGDIAYSPALPSWACLECIKAGTTGKTESFAASSEPGTVFEDGTSTWVMDSIKDGHLPGEVVKSYGKLKGHYVLDGSEVNIKKCPRLVKVIKENNLAITESEWNSKKNGFVLYESRGVMRLPDLRTTNDKLIAQVKY